MKMSHERLAELVEKAIGVMVDVLDEQWSDEVVSLQYELDKAWETIERQAADIEYIETQLDDLYEANECLHNELNGKSHGNAKLTPTDIQYIDLMLSKGVSTTNIGKIFDVHPRTIRHVRARTNWKHL